MLVSLWSRIPAKRGVSTANRREICCAAIAEDIHSSSNSFFKNLPLFSSTPHTVKNNSKAYILAGVTGKLESVILSAFHCFEVTSD